MTYMGVAKNAENRKIFPYIDNILIVLGIIFVVYLVVKGVMKRRKAAERE